MSTLAQRSTLLGLIDEACSTGARLHKACALIGLAARTVQRWVDAGKTRCTSVTGAPLISAFITARPTSSVMPNGRRLWAC